MGLFSETVGQYKSNLYETARNLLKSRNNQRARAISLRDQLEAERKANEQLRAENQQLAQPFQSIQRHNQELRRHEEQFQTQPLVLPPDPPLPHHQFGARMISICIQLAKTVGLRASLKVLKLIFDWLSIKANLPDWTTVRAWLCRMGVDELKHGGEKHDDWIWMADHSNQIGQEKVLTILGVRASKLPAPGERGWLSTEILESAFGLYKSLEGQHSKSGFPSLLAGFGALLKPCTPAEVKESFSRTSVKDVKEWTATHLNKTLASKKNTAHRRTLPLTTGN